MIDYIEAGGRCKQVLFLRRHRCVKYRGAGYRCKYCGTPLIRLRKQDANTFNYSGYSNTGSSNYLYLENSGVL